MREFFGLSVVCVPVLTGCAATAPPLADEQDLPITKIVSDAVCNTRAAFLAVSKRPEAASFDPTSWAMSIKLEPRNTVQIDLGIGATYKIPQFLTSLGAGAGIGTGWDMSGSSTGTVQYSLRSEAFFNPRNEKLFEYCSKAPGRYQYDLTSAMKLDDWMMRFIGPLDGNVLTLGSKSDAAFIYKTNLSVYYGGGITARYTVASERWAGGPSIGAKRTQDIALTLTFTKDKEGRGRNVSAGAQNKLQLLDLSSTIQQRTP